MFDYVGRNNDEEATKRSFLSLLITSFLIGGGVAFVAGVAAFQVVEVLDDPVTETGIDVWARLDDPEEFDKPALPPLPPPPLGGMAVDPDVEELPKPEPDQMAEQQKVLEEPPTKLVERTLIVGLGDPDGDPDGAVRGVLGGTKDGNSDGCFGCTGSGGYGDGGHHVFHRRELEVRRRVIPEYPKQALEGNLGEHRCKAWVSMDSKGVPHDVRVESCPTLFHKPTRDALLKWRWYPPKVGKRRVAGVVQISVVFAR